MRLHKNAKVEYIRRVPLFTGCSKAELGHIAMIADELTLPPARTVIREGDRGREFLVVIDGTATIRQQGEQIGTLGPGDFAGEIALVTDSPRTATIETETDFRVLVISGPAFRSLLRRSPSIEGKILQELARRLAHDAP